MAKCRDVYDCHVKVVAKGLEGGLLFCFFVLEYCSEMLSCLYFQNYQFASKRFLFYCLLLLDKIVWVNLLVNICLFSGVGKVPPTHSGSAA